MHSNIPKRGTRSYASDRGFGRMAIIVRGYKSINGERWIVAEFVDTCARLCVHPSALEVAA